MTSWRDSDQLPQVFISYHHADNFAGTSPWGAARVTQFRVQLSSMIKNNASGSAKRDWKASDKNFDPTYMDIMDKTAGEAYWRKIYRELSRTALFVAIMTGGYLDSKTCQMEWQLFWQLYQQHDRPRTFYTIRLAPDKVLEEELARPAWAGARLEWEEDALQNGTCADAFLYGPRDPAWGDLIKAVSAEALKWLTWETVPVPEAPSLTGQPTVGQAVGVQYGRLQETRGTIQAWRIDGKDIVGPDGVSLDTDTYTPRPEDAGHQLDALVRFDRDHFLPTYEHSTPVVVAEGSVPQPTDPAEPVMKETMSKEDSRAVGAVARPRGRAGRYEDDPLVVLEHARGLVNSSYWQRAAEAEGAVAELRALAAVYEDQPEIVLEFTKGLFTLSNKQYVAQAVGTVAELGGLAERYEDQPEIALWYAMALVNLSHGQDEAQAVGTVAKLGRLVDRYEDQPEIALWYARGLGNLSGRQHLAGAVATVAKLESLAARYADEPEIVLEYAKGLVKLSNRQDAETAASTMSRVFRVATAFKDRFGHPMFD